MTRRFQTITRRTLLRGAGAAVALPWLEVMRNPVPLSPEPAPTRLACLFMPNGVLPGPWTPKDEGADYTLTPSLEPLKPVKDQVMVLSGMRNRRTHFGEGHYTKTAGVFTGEAIRKTGGKDVRNGVSLDQLVAQHVGRKTLLPSLVLGTEPARHVVDMGFSTVYGAHVSWRTPTVPAQKEIHPRRAFDRVFRVMRAGPGDLSVLDVVLEDARRLKSRLGRADREKLDEYLESVRALEVRITAWSGPHPAGADGRLAPPPDRPTDHQAHVRIMLDLIVEAFRTGATRVASFMFGNAVSNRSFSFLDGVEGGHHHLSHHKGEAENKRQYQLINRWHVAELARMLQRMKRIPEGEGSLLDNVAVLFASGLRDGDRHDPNNLPVLLGGGGGGRLLSGRHLRLPRHTPLCNLHLALLDLMGVSQESFGDSTGVLEVVG